MIELKSVVSSLYRKLSFKKAVSAIEARRAEELAKEIRTRHTGFAISGYLESCYAKDGKIMLGKHSLSPKVYERILSDEALKTYKTAMRNNTTMSNAKLILENNRRFVEEYHKNGVIYNKGFGINRYGQIWDYDTNAPASQMSIQAYRQHLENLSNL